jgi:enoyl-CoA hydratase/carnithine racemase
MIIIIIFILFKSIFNYLLSLRGHTAQFRAVVLTGNGKSFSAGADLNWMKKMASYTQVRRHSSIRLSHKRH